MRRIFVSGQLLDVSGAGYETEGKFSHEAPALSRPSRSLCSCVPPLLLPTRRLARSETDERIIIKGDPTEGALVVAAAKAGLHKALLDSEFPRTDEIPFSSETKRMTTLHKTPAGVVAYSKGAPEIILDSCARQLIEDGETELKNTDRAEILYAAQEMAREALRVLVVAYKRDATLETAERDMTFIGLVGMIDPPRPEAKVAIEKCKQAGIKAVMITGDHPLTARAVATELGLLTQGRVVTGAELELTDDEEFQSEVEK